jgi:hypothetical protein
MNVVLFHPLLLALLLDRLDDVVRMVESTRIFLSCTGRCVFFLNELFDSESFCSGFSSMESSKIH